MDKVGLNELRAMFREFYENKGHYPKKSASLVPDKDKSLLLINSGMAPLKPYFAGIETPPGKRMTTCQKCIRTGDIDNVGLTARHGTFFEMLGSFSFGDYFKKESLEWGWEFMTRTLKLPEDKLWATVYEEDDEAYDLWKDCIGLSEDHIVRLGKKDNFWEIGIGPCGPCSEIYYDRGEEYGCDDPNCKPGCECDRYVEFWNHVFTQFSKDAEGNYTPLEQKNIDTGMGLERLACIMQGVDSIFDIDTIRFILDEVVRISGMEYHEGKAKSDVSIRIITDHIRSVTFMIGDNILPSNEGRGYVLRRLLRRAARHGKLLGIEGSFLADLSGKVIETSGVAYPELEEKREYIYKILSIEEEKFSNTIDQGMNLLTEQIKEMKEGGETILSGEKAFRLYDTFGFPIELTKEILEEEGLTADETGFQEFMEQQKQMARAARKSETDAGWTGENFSYGEGEVTKFVGYDTLTAQGIVKGILKDQKALEELKEGEQGMVILDQTPFYGEGGGQEGDTGLFYSNNFKAEVMATTKVHDVFLHQVRITEGKMKLRDVVNTVVNAACRNNIARNHTATHLLHKTLKDVLGQHVEQAGSSVTSEGLRFDFTHFEGVSKGLLADIEQTMNEKISQFLPVVVKEMSQQDAFQTGATAQFGEKYGDRVRVVFVGDYSTELCGGTHVENTGQIGAFKILSESGVAAGVRRIEGITGHALYLKLSDQEQTLRTAAELLKTNADGLTDRITALQEEVKAQRKELDEFRAKAVDNAMGNMMEDAVEINGIQLVCRKFTGLTIEDLRTASDKLREGRKGLISVLASENDGKVTFLVSVSDDLLDQGYHAGNMIKQIAAAAGGGGGGKANMAQAGAKDPSKIEAAFTVARDLIGGGC